METSGIGPSSFINDPFYNIPMSNIDIGRESIPVLDLSTSFGRESLGILKLGCDFNTADLSQKSISFAESDISQNILDQGFILSRRPSIQSASTLSLKSSNFSFNLFNFDVPSVIENSDFSNSWEVEGSTNRLNDGFLYTTRPSLYAQFRSRFHSVPLYTSKKNDNNEELIQQMFNRVSEGCTQMNRSVKDDSDQTEDGFNDSVFIEARHLTNKFSDEGSNDGFTLDETDPPELINVDLEDDKNKCNSGDVFKKLDKLLPVDSYKKLNNRISNHSSDKSKKTSHSTSKIEDKIGSTNKLAKEKCENIVVVEEPNSMTINNSSGNLKQCEVDKSQKILQSLSMILAKDNRTEKETEEGNALLYTLADMLGNGFRQRSKSLTSHSLNSNRNSVAVTNTSCNVRQPLENSNSERGARRSNAARVSPVVPKNRSSNSFSHPSNLSRPKLNASSGRSSSLDISKSGSLRSIAADLSVEKKNTTAENVQMNLKVKRASGAVQVKRGPMKATVPLESISKSRAKGTPPRTQHTLPKLHSRISTPIRDVHLKPMAQSTPDRNVDNYSSSMEQSNVRSFSSPNLKEISYPRSSQASLKDSSTSFKDRSSQQSFLPRRNSVSDSRRSSISSNMQKSNSLKETSLMKAMNKIRQNMSGYSSRGALRDTSNLTDKDGTGNICEKVGNASRSMVSGTGKENVSASS